MGTIVVGKKKKKTKRAKLKAAETAVENTVLAEEIAIAAPLEVLAAPTSVMAADYDFYAEVQKDWKNEKRLLCAEFAIVFGIILIAVAREILIRLATQK